MEGQADFDSCVGKEISVLVLKDNTLSFVFTDGVNLDLFDNGQSCCEKRYAETGDDLEYFVGSKLVSAEVNPGPTDDKGGETRGCAFLVVTTDKGAFTVANYNEHNGYYGGFLVSARVPK